MILETERLYLRPLESGDLDRLAAMYSNMNVMRFIGAGKTFSRQQTEKSIDSWGEYEAKHGFSNWAVIRKNDGAFLGKCGLSHLPDDSDVEISYIFDEQFWGMGYATEISKAVLQYGFDKLGLKQIVALTYPQNSPSIKVLEKIGLKYQKEADYWGVKFLFFKCDKP